MGEYPLLPALIELQESPEVAKLMPLALVLLREDLREGIKHKRQPVVGNKVVGSQLRTL